MLLSQSSLLPAAWCDSPGWFWRPVCWQNIFSCLAYLWTALQNVFLVYIHGRSKLKELWIPLHAKKFLQVRRRLEMQFHGGSVGRHCGFCIIAFLTSKSCEFIHANYFCWHKWPCPTTFRRGCRETVMVDSHIKLAHFHNITASNDAAVNWQHSCTQTTSVSCETRKKKNW